MDTRFSYCAVYALALMNKLDLINRVKARNFILLCKNIDGAFGGMPGAESHAAYVFTAIGTLKILGDEDLIDRDQLGMWLSQRQTVQVASMAGLTSWRMCATRGGFCRAAS